MNSLNPLTVKKLIVAMALCLSTTSAGLAQSQRNYGPNGPATGDTFGEPYSGTAAARRGDWLPYTAYSPYRHWHHHHVYR
jgi:hypothetical protein